MIARLRELLGIAGGQFASIALGAVAVKVIATSGGPAGILTYSMLRQVSDLAVTVGTINAPQAIVRGIAARPAGARGDFFLSAACLAACGLVIGAVLLSLVASDIAWWMFGPAGTAGTVRLAIPLSWLVATSLICLAVLNGMQAYRTVSVIQVCAAAAAALAAWPITREATPRAYVLLAAVGPAVALVLSAGLLWRRRSDVHRQDAGSPRPRRTDANDFLRLGLPTLAMGIMGTAGNLTVRALYMDVHGRTVAGWFDASSTIANLVAGTALSALMVHALPRLTAAAVEGKAAVLRAAREYLGIAAAIGAGGAFVLLAGRTVALPLLYSDEFLGASELLMWLAAANYLRVPWMVFGILWMATMDRRKLLGCELFLQGFPLLAAFLLLPHGPNVVPIAVVVAHGIMLAYGAWTFRIRFGMPVAGSMLIAWLTGIVGLAALAWGTWRVETALEGLPWFLGTTLAVVALYAWLLRIIGRRAT